MYQRLNRVLYWKTYGSKDAQSKTNIYKPISPIYVLSGNGSSTYYSAGTENPGDLHKVSEGFSGVTSIGKSGFLEISIDQDAINGTSWGVEKEGEKLDNWAIHYFDVKIDVMKYVYFEFLPCGGLILVLLGLGVWINYRAHKELEYDKKRRDVYVERDELTPAFDNRGFGLNPNHSVKFEPSNLGQINEYRNVLRRTHTTLGDRGRVDTDPYLNLDKSKDRHVSIIGSQRDTRPEVYDQTFPLVDEKSKLIN